MAPKPQSLDWSFLNLESVSLSLLAVGASGTAEPPAGVERGKWFIGGTERTEALLFPWLITGRNFYWSERDTLALKITPGSRIVCIEDKVKVRLLAGSIGIPIVAHFLLLRVACLVAVSGRLVERAPHRLTLSSFPSFPAPERCRTSRVLISSFALGRYPRDAGILAVTWVAAVVAVDGAVASPGQVHSNPTTHDRG